MPRAPLAAVLILCAGLALPGCSSGGQQQTISKQTVEQGIADALQKQVGDRPDTVTCPGPLKAEAGASERCQLTAAGLRYGVTATITSYQNGTANYQVKVDSQPSGRA